MSKLKPGKLPHSLLNDLLAQNKLDDDSVLISSGIGEDAAVINTGGANYLVLTTDPVSFATEQLGWYCVNINANDVACMGATPRWLLVTLLLPDTGMEEGDVKSIFADLLEACNALHVSLIGGHTEVTQNLDRPIMVGQMIGEVEKDKLVHVKNTRPGDVVVLTKAAGIEGTAIIANEKQDYLRGALDNSLIESAKHFLKSPGISVLADAGLAKDHPGVHGMHDPTEGGVATACHEIAIASGCGIRVSESSIPVLAETRAVCDLFGLDPLGLIASGALLVTCESSTVDGLLSTYQSNGIPATIIGEILGKEDGSRLRRSTDEIELPVFEQDEITRL